MAKTDLTAERLRELLDYNPETGVFTWKVFVSSHALAGNVAGSTNRRGYMYISFFNKKYLAHRLAWLHITGVWPSEYIDHIDGDPKNNSFKNLRESTPGENMQNQRGAKSSNTHGFFGVYRNGKRFSAYIKVNGVRRYLGIFINPEDANAAYISAKRALHPFCTI